MGSATAASSSTPATTPAATAVGAAAAAATAASRPALARTGRSAYRERHPPPEPEGGHSALTREPLASLYIAWRGLTSFLLLPVWAAYYVFRSRPRPSWSLGQAVQVAWLRYVAVLPERTNRAFGTRPPEAEPARAGRETDFLWATPLPAEERLGVLLDPEVAFQDRIGLFVWPKVVGRSSSTEGGGLIGLCFHGGALVHGNASEQADMARIPRRLMKDDAFARIYSVEYRLIHHTAWPGHLQDAASAYHFLVRKLSIDPARIVLIGDSAGGNICLGLARWLRDAAVPTLGRPAGLLLFSPWTSPSHAFPYEPNSHVPRPNRETDYLLDEPAPRSLLVATLLGHHPPSLVHSPYISPACWQLSGRPGLFKNFPPIFVHYGGAERLEFEIEALIDGLELDGIPTTVVRSADAVHDVCILRVWDEHERDRIWDAAVRWLRSLEGDRAVRQEAAVVGRLS